MTRAAMGRHAVHLSPAGDRSRHRSAHDREHDRDADKDRLRDQDDDSDAELDLDDSPEAALYTPTDSIALGLRGRRANRDPSSENGEKVLPVYVNIHRIRRLVIATVGSCVRALHILHSSC